MEIELVVGTIHTKPWVRLCAMPPATVFFYVGTLFCSSAMLASSGVRLPFNMSSTERGQIWRPALLAFIEDAGAVEGGGGVEYRKSVLKRWEASPHFRSMVMSLTWFWGICFMLNGSLSTILILKMDEDVAFGIGWSLPWMCGLLQTIVTIPFIKGRLRKEKTQWRLDEKIVPEDRFVESA